MYGYGIAETMVGYARTPEEGIFTLTGKLPGKEPVTGEFDGQITIKDAQGEEYVYDDMLYGWVGELLFLQNRGEDNKYTCIYDPETPARSVFIDLEWQADPADLSVLAYVDDSLTEAEARAIESKFQSIKGIASVTFISAQEAYEDFMAANGNSDAFAGMDASYLHHRYEVVMESGAELEKVVEILEDIEGVSEVSVRGTLTWYRIFAATDDPKELMDLVLAYEDMSMPEYVEQPSVDVPARDDDLPRAYAPIVSEYERLVEYRLSSSFNGSSGFTPSTQLQTMINSYDLQYQWDCMVAEMLPYSYSTVTPASYGYILMDLNDDSIQELLWVSADHAHVFAIFTLRGESPILLDCFWARYDCVILDDGTVYTLGSGGADYYEYAFLVLDSQYSELKVINSFGCEGGTYYQVNQGQWKKINYDLFSSMLDGYPFEFGWDWYDQEITTLQ